MLRLIEYSTKFHGLSKLALIDRLIERVIKTLFFRTADQRAKFRQIYLDEFKKTPLFERCKKDPEKFLQFMAIVQAPYNSSHKGLITIAYNYAFPAFLLLFDVEKVMTRYHIVLEPSTARLFMPEVIIYDELPAPVFVQYGEEKRDADFLERYCHSLKPVPIAANWWLNTNIFRIDRTIEKRYDVIMVSSFTKLKRHKLLFGAMAKAKAQGKNITAICVGYEGRYTKADIERFAEEAGVSEQVTVVENLNPDQVAVCYNQSRINLLLSTREGYNRSIIEGMYCGVPILLREGFNFGQKYSFITPKSGDYYRDHTLMEDILNLIDRVKQGSIDTLDVVSTLKISAQGAADALKASIYGHEPVEVALKASCLGGMEYFGDKTKEDFTNDYNFLRSCLL